VARGVEILRSPLPKQCLVFRLADRVILLDQVAKGIIAEGPPRRLAAASADPRVREFLRSDLDWANNPLAPR
jgi:hypothetical protein